jgi:flagellar biosynthesis/type III secretory pathway protein FliH
MTLRERILRIIKVHVDKADVETLLVKLEDEVEELIEDATAREQDLGYDRGFEDGYQEGLEAGDYE